MSKTVVIIPALDPDERLIEYCEDLLRKHGGPIVLVDDGSCNEKQSIFDRMAKKDGIIVIHHPYNLGKGRALKNSFAQVAIWSGMDVSDYELSEGIRVDYGSEENIGELFAGAMGVITADSDGQHSVKDVIAISEEIAKGASELVLGARDFDSDNVPARSETGNKITRFLFRLLYRTRLVDTQTGLRGVSMDLIPTYLQCKGERFEFELDMLIVSARTKIPMKEIPIETIYENANEGTHFRTIVDSCAVYRVLFGPFLLYLISSVTSFVIDILIFQVALLILAFAPEGSRIYASTIVARVVSSIYNYLINKKLVFGKEGDGAKTAVGYYLLVIVQMFLSGSLVLLVHKILPIPETVIKVMVDTLLFVVSFQVQKRIIFRKKD